MDEQLNTLRTTNWELLNYFRSAYVRQSEQLQSLKSELFELDVKLEELEKTKNLYTFQSDSHRSIFSPISAETREHGRNQILQSQLSELQSVRTSLVQRIARQETDVKAIRDHIQALEAANQSLTELYQKLPQEEDSTVSASEEETVDTAVTDTTEDLAFHAYQLLMLNQYDKSQIAERIHTSLQQGLEGDQNKLEVLKWLIQSDPTRARLTIQELQDSNARLLQLSNSLIQELNPSVTVSKPIWMAIEDCIQEYRTGHPECIMDVSVDCSDYDLKVLPIITLTLLQLLQEILNNAFFYSNANKILIKIYINSRMIDAYINDNGVGIPADYLTASSWHSGLHRLHEIVHLLGGKLQIDGDIISGTNVRFSFPVYTEVQDNAKPADAADRRNDTASADRLDYNGAAKYINDTDGHDDTGSVEYACNTNRQDFDSKDYTDNVNNKINTDKN